MGVESKRCQPGQSGNDRDGAEWAGPLLARVQISRGLSIGSTDLGGPVA